MSTHVEAGYNEHNLRGTTVVGCRTMQPSLAEQIVLPRATRSDGRPNGRQRGKRAIGAECGAAKSIPGAFPST
jgi:hypothetical protein